MARASYVACSITPDLAPETVELAVQKEMTTLEEKD